MYITYDLDDQISEVGQQKREDTVEAHQITRVYTTDAEVQYINSPCGRRGRL